MHCPRSAHPTARHARHTDGLNANTHTVYNLSKHRIDADTMKEDARKMVLTMVDMERSYLTADVFRDIISQNGAVDGAEQPNMLRTLSGQHCACPWAWKQHMSYCIS